MTHFTKNYAQHRKVLTSAKKSLSLAARSNFLILINCKTSAKFHACRLICSIISQTTLTTKSLSFLVQIIPASTLFQIKG